MDKLIKKPIIGITMGDPTGIGPEIIVKALEQKSIWEVCTPLVFGDPGIMENALDFLSSKVTLCPVETVEEIDQEKRQINLLSLSNIAMDEFSYGKPDRRTGAAMVFYIKEAINLALRKKIDAVVTCPINKAVMSLVGYSYPGHTELLAEATKADEYAMMLAGEKLRVVLVTIHHSLREVPDILTAGKIISTIRITNTALKKYFGLQEPKLAVAALNPHAGEGGIFGNEEEKIITPAICKAREDGINASGPFASDTLFFYASRGKFDAVICMYHDQGLIPLKLLHFEDAVNITLGIPIIRTSVDHGTAYDIAGTGTANPQSLIRAIETATQMAVFKT